MLAFSELCSLSYNNLTGLEVGLSARAAYQCKALGFIFLKESFPQAASFKEQQRALFQLAGIHQGTSPDRPKLTIPCPGCLPVTARDRTKIYMLVTGSSREESMPVSDRVEGTLPS